MLNFQLSSDPNVANFCRAQNDVFTRNRLIVEIMNGENPLTVSMVERLAANNPARWSAYVGYVRAFHAAKPAADH